MEKEIVTGQNCSVETMLQNSQQLIEEATRFIEQPDANPEKADSIKQSLVSLIAMLTQNNNAQINAPTPLGGSVEQQGSVSTLPPDGEMVLTHVAPPPQQQPPTRVPYEMEARLSESIIWKLQEEYYSSLGIDAWNNQVPFFVTSSTFIAESYAELIIAFLRDYRQHINPEEPIYIIEMATGSGRFSQYLLRELANKQKYFSELNDLKLRYVMTDFTEKNIEYWESHERFKPFVESGMLDFAVFRPEQFDSIRLRVAKQKVCGKVVKNPVIAIANYFFDTIRQDLFRVNAHKLEEGKLSVIRNLEGKNPQDPVRMPDLDPVYSYYPTKDDYYKDPAYNRILQHYKENFYKGSVIFPLGALNCVRNLQSLSNNNLVLISSDKGFTDMDFMLGHRDHGYCLHEGAFSYMVNYDAIRRYFENDGGVGYSSCDKNLDLQTVLNIRTQQPCKLENVNYLFTERLNRVNPINYFYMVQDLFDENTKNNPSDRMDGLLAFLRLNLCDPASFCRYASMMFDSLENISFAQREDLLRVIDKTWNNFYDFNGEANLPFWIAQILYGLRMHEQSLSYFEKTLARFGPHEVVFYFMGKCHEHMGHLETALDLYRKSAEKNEEFAPAHESLAELEIIMRSRGVENQPLRP